jgi:undecaprenol kinase
MQTRKNQPFPSRLRFALAGVVHAMHTERSLRTQAIALLAIVIVLALLHLPPLWWALVILAASAVLAAELFNTALERLADHLHPELHPEIRLMKDCAAGGVLIASAGALGVAIALLIALIRGDCCAGH